MRRFWKHNGLSVVLLALFLAMTAGMALVGWHVHNDDLRDAHRPELGLVAYLASGHFIEGIFENWESEFLQMAAYVVLTAYLVQRGSAESKPPDDEPGRELGEANEAPLSADSPGPARRGGWRLKIYENSLAIALLTLFAASFAGHAIGGLREFNEERSWEGQGPVSLRFYLASPRFWYESLQNWQSEFLAVFSLVVLSIWLRQKGSPESKGVNAPHWKTGK